MSKCDGHITPQTHLPDFNASYSPKDLLIQKNETIIPSKEDSCILFDTKINQQENQSKSQPSFQEIKAQISYFEIMSTIIIHLQHLCDVDFVNFRKHTSSLGENCNSLHILPIAIKLLTLIMLQMPEFKWLPIYTYNLKHHILVLTVKAAFGVTTSIKPSNIISQEQLFPTLIKTISNVASRVDKISYYDDNRTKQLEIIKYRRFNDFKDVSSSIVDLLLFHDIILTLLSFLGLAYIFQEGKDFSLLTIHECFLTNKLDEVIKKLICSYKIKVSNAYDINSDFNSRLILKLGAVISTLKLTRQKIIHAQQCSKSKHNQCLDRRKIHHHQEYFDTEIPKICLVAYFSDFLLDLLELATYEFSHDILTALNSVGICCCMHPNTTLPKLLNRLKKSDSCLQIHIFEVLEKTLYHDMGGNSTSGSCFMCNKMQYSFVETRNLEKISAASHFHNHTNHLSKNNEILIWSSLLLYKDLLLEGNRLSHRVLWHLKELIKIVKNTLSSIIFSKIIIPALYTYHEHLKDSMSMETKMTIIYLLDLVTFLMSFRSSFVTKFNSENGQNYILDFIQDDFFRKDALKALALVVKNEVNLCDAAVCHKEISSHNVTNKKTANSKFNELLSKCTQDFQLKFLEDSPSFESPDYEDLFPATGEDLEKMNDFWGVTVKLLVKCPGYRLKDMRIPVIRNIIDKLGQCIHNRSAGKC